MQQKQPRSTAIFSICASSDIQGLERWETHLHPLERAGTVSSWSARHLQAGSERQKNLRDYLDQADLIILLLSADFFIDEECEALMELALIRHQKGTARVVPLLLRPVAFRETKLATFKPLPSNGSPITQWHDPDAAFNDCVRELRHILGRPITGPLPYQQKRVLIEEQNRERMLQRLRRTYEELFAQSLAGVTQIELDLANKPDAVQNATTLLFQTQTRPAQLLPPGTPILDVYDKATYELLILGAPGAGKSTLLVELARHLVKRAEADELHSLPVMLPLSSWAIKRSPLHIWLPEQVALFYDIPKEIAQRWTNEGQLLPLLDGLDEMEKAARPACIEAINAYHREHLRLPLVVCSRQAEYDAAAETQRLALQNAVVVLPLKHEQIEQYLTQAGKPLSALRHVLAANSALAEIATTPLMMHILILTYQGTEVRSLSTQHDQLQRQVWTDYLARMVERKGNTTRYPLELTRSWLQWQAQQMRAHSQTVFYLEHIQPDWLTDKHRRAYQWFGVLLPATIIGALVSILFVQLALNSLINLKGLGWIQTMTIGGFLGGLLCPKGQNNTTRAVPKTLSQWGRAFSMSICVGLIIGFSQGWGYDMTLHEWLSDGCIYGVLSSLSSFLLLLLLPAFPRRSAPTSRSSLKWWTVLSGFFQAVHPWRSLLVGLLTGLSLGLSAGLSQELNGLNAATEGLLSWAEFCIASILIDVIFELEHLQDGIHLTERVSWTWRNLRDRLFALAHFCQVLTSAGCITAAIWLGTMLIFFAGSLGPNGLRISGLRPEMDSALSLGLCFGLSYGLLEWLLFGLYQSITQERIEDQDRRLPNQGTLRSLRNSLLFGLIIGTMIGGMGIVTPGLSYGLEYWLNYGQLSIGLSRGVNFGSNIFWPVFIESIILFWLIVGGLAVWRHYLIRFLLQWTQTFPWKASQFLDNATERILLQRLGGGYRFIHRLLLDSLVDAMKTNIDSTNGGTPKTPLLNPSKVRSMKQSGSRPQILAALLILVVALSCVGVAIYNQNAAIANNPYALLGEQSTLAFADPLSQETGSLWSSNFTYLDQTCQFTDGAYHVSRQTRGSFMACYSNRIVSNFAFEVHLAVIQGDCGGMIFRNDRHWHLYYFDICQDGTYAVRKFSSASDTRNLQSGHSSAIHTGLRQQNKIAVVADGSKISFYINNQRIYQMQDNNSYVSGDISLIASPRYDHATDVAYSNARLWIIHS